MINVNDLPQLDIDAGIAASGESDAISSVGGVIVGIVTGIIAGVVGNEVEL